VTQAVPEIALVDFGMGNLRSVARALERVGAKAVGTSDPHVVRRAERVVLPGVGSSGEAMRVLRARGIDEAIVERIRSGGIFLGICLGLQLLLERTEEGPAECLGVIPGRVAGFDRDLGLPVPHMGWNLVEVAGAHPVLRSGYYYFVHGFRAQGVPDAYRIATTDYAGPFPSAIGFGACLAVQFHPEKSQGLGLGFFERFVSWKP
jgi:glutamine amidotransferase